MRNRRCGAARQSRHSQHLQNPGGAELVECGTELPLIGLLPRTAVAKSGVNL